VRFIVSDWAKVNSGFGKNEIEPSGLREAKIRRKYNGGQKNGYE
jgi:hypothetical protein